MKFTIAIEPRTDTSARGVAVEKYLRRRPKGKDDGSSRVDRLTDSV